MSEEGLICKEYSFIIFVSLASAFRGEVGVGLLTFPLGGTACLPVGREGGFALLLHQFDGIGHNNFGSRFITQLNFGRIA